MSSTETGERRQDDEPQDQRDESPRLTPESLAERRARYLTLFESWLDRAFDEEVAPDGLDASILEGLAAGAPPALETDLYTVYEALTALTQEVKLQGRAFKDLETAVTPLAARLEDASSGHEEALAEARSIADSALETAKDLESARIREAEDRCFLDSVELLLDLRDRLVRGVAAAEALLSRAQRQLAGPLARLLSGFGPAPGALSEAVSALLKGNRLTLDHLEDALRERGVSVIECEGRPFEPERMSAVDLVETREAPEGFVVEVYRPGYEWNGSVLRAAQVKVARRPAGGPA